MRSIIFIIIFAGAIFAKAQHLTPMVISGGGSDSNTGDYHLSWTLGEATIATHIQQDVTLLQGFHQPNYIFTRLLESPVKDIDIQIFPNPASDHIKIDVAGVRNKLKVELYDLPGRLVMISDLAPSINVIDLSAIPDGAYMLRVSGNNGIRLGIWRILKI